MNNTYNLDWVRSRFDRQGPQLGFQAGFRDRGDKDLNPDLHTPKNLKPAAVLIPLVKRPSELTILLTRRTDTLSVHAGQISFPGGRVEKYDLSPEDTALRETEEEIGLPRDRIETLGRLDDYITRTNFKITPIVAAIRTSIGS